MIVIGITGYKRSGKDTSAQILAEYGFKQYAFADALRLMAAAVDPVISLSGCPDSVFSWMHHSSLAAAGPQHSFEYRYNHIIDVVGYDRAKDIPDFRRFLQRLGAEGVRGTFGPQAWVRALDHRLMTDRPARVVITDVRFYSEAEWVHNHGGLLWRVVRPGVGGDDPHPSETEIPNLPADAELEASTVPALQCAVRRLLSQCHPNILAPTLTPDAHAYALRILRFLSSSISSSPVAASSQATL